MSVTTAKNQPQTQVLDSETAPVSSPEPPEIPLPPQNLIFDDGEPLETYRHRLAMNVLLDSLPTAFAERNDYFAGGNMFVYYSSEQVKNKDFRGPDFFVVLNVDGERERQGWVVWEESGRYPDVIIELMSSSTAQIDTGIKKEIYGEIFRTPDYFVYHPFDPNSLKGWRLQHGKGYQELERNERGWLWSESLGLWLGNWSGTINKVTTTWLRFYAPEGNLILLPKEAAQQELELEKQRADAAQQEADLEKQRADAAQQELELEKQRAEYLAARLRELGENPDL